MGFCPIMDFCLISGFCLIMGSCLIIDICLIMGVRVAYARRFAPSPQPRAWDLNQVTLRQSSDCRKNDVSFFIEKHRLKCVFHDFRFWESPDWPQRDATELQSQRQLQSVLLTRGLPFILAGRRSVSERQRVLEKCVFVECQGGSDRKTQ